MTTLGIVLMTFGALLFYGSKIVFKYNEKRSGKAPISKDAQTVALINNATLAARVIGAVFVIVGVIIIIFIK
ncbi:MAG: hypothetical protein H7X94_08120 [Vallitaleaceae bacterium]|nr:hypothetical protein [Vallitaleaceae bacterium]